MAKNDTAITPAKNLSITLTIDPDRADIVRRAFSDQKDPADVAAKIAQLATDEFIDLIGGRKRYISLSHQYIEWLQALYAAVLPGEEYTYRRLLDKFNFPPGTASYVSRVLRQRQNTTLHQRAKDGLAKKLRSEVENYDGLPKNDPERVARKQPSIQLTVREHDLLQSAIDQLLTRGGINIAYPQVTFRGREFVIATYNVDHMRTVLPEIDSL